MGRFFGTIGIVVALAAISLGLYLFRPFLEYPSPAELRCVDPTNGHFEPLGEPHVVYGLGLSYAGHIAESPGLYDPEAPPPTFQKHAHSVNRTDEVPYPTREALLEAAAKANAAHAAVLSSELEALPPLLDYEVEVGIAVLEPISVNDLRDPAFAPPIGFFVANDLTARILIGMAPDFASTVPFLAEGKGLVGFLPVGDQIFLPNTPVVDGWVCVPLETLVNGELRQSAPSTNIILGPREILLTVAEQFRLSAFEKADWVVTGTPPGVALQTPGWMQRAMVLVDPPATMKVGAMAGNAASGAFLEPGDEVTVRAGFLGEKTVHVRATP